MFKIRLDASNYIKLLGNVLNRKWHKTFISVTYEIHAHKIHVYEMYIYKMHIHKIYIYEIYTHKIHIYD
jgi:hypothetical protein